MRAFFITTPTGDCTELVAAWNSVFPRADHMVFQTRGIDNGGVMLRRARETRPDIAFYIGPNVGRGAPKPATLKAMRDICPFVNLCCDATDSPWHGPLKYYRAEGCFDLQVSLDGAIDAPVDHATLTPVRVGPFEAPVGRVDISAGNGIARRRRGDRDIHFGFSGNTTGKRREIIAALRLFGGLTCKPHGLSYEEHAAFMTRCRMILNVSYTGSGERHHMKGRVLEAGWARACLLEHADSPIGHWFPKDCYVAYRSAKEAAEIARDITDGIIEKTAARLAEEVRARFTPRQIYTEILERVGHTQPVAAA